MSVVAALIDVFALAAFPLLTDWSVTVVATGIIDANMSGMTCVGIIFAFVIVVAFFDNGAEGVTVVAVSCAIVATWFIDTDFNTSYAIVKVIFAFINVDTNTILLFVSSLTDTISVALNETTLTLTVETALSVYEVFVCITVVNVVSAFVEINANAVNQDVTNRTNALTIVIGESTPALTIETALSFLAVFVSIAVIILVSAFVDVNIAAIDSDITVRTGVFDADAIYLGEAICTKAAFVIDETTFAFAVEPTLSVLAIFVCITVVSVIGTFVDVNTNSIDKYEAGLTNTFEAR